MEYSLQNLNLPQTSSPFLQGNWTPNRLTESHRDVYHSCGQFLNCHNLVALFSAAHVGHMFDSLSHFLKDRIPLDYVHNSICVIYVKFIGLSIIYGFKLSLPWGWAFSLHFLSTTGPSLKWSVLFCAYFDGIWYSFTSSPRVFWGHVRPLKIGQMLPQLDVDDVDCQAIDGLWERKWPQAKAAKVTSALVLPGLWRFNIACCFGHPVVENGSSN